MAEANTEILAQNINVICDWIQKSFEDINDVPEYVSKNLAYPVARLANIMIPFQKLSETVYATQNQMSVNPSQHGHDLVDKNGAHIEHKSSKATRGVVTNKNNGTTKKKKRRHCNVNWTFPALDLTEEERRERLIDSVEEKTHNGYMIIDIKDSLERPLYEYKLSSKFLKEYFIRIYRDKAKINLGCDQCDTCKHFHRVKNLHDASKKFDDTPNIDTDKLFESYNIFGNIKSQCGKK